MFRRNKLQVPPGGRAFKVHLRAIASATVPVVIESDELADIALSYGCAVEDLPFDRLVVDVVLDRAVDNAPGGLGICCSGGRWATEPSLELGDVWEPITERLVVGAENLEDACVEITPKDGD